MARTALIISIFSLLCSLAAPSFSQDSRWGSSDEPLSLARRSGPMLRVVRSLISTFLSRTTIKVLQPLVVATQRQTQSQGIQTSRAIANLVT
jgi:hypothetical protein